MADKNLETRIAQLEAERDRALAEAERWHDTARHYMDELEQAQKEAEAERDRLERENEQLQAALGIERDRLKRAKDPNPVERPSLKRVLKLVADACMRLERIQGGWLLKLGHLVRRFKNLKQIWEILIADNWLLSEIFPPDKPGVAPKLRSRHPILASASRDMTASFYESF